MYDTHAYPVFWLVAFYYTLTSENLDSEKLSGVQLQAR